MSRRESGRLGRACESRTRRSVLLREGNRRTHQLFEKVKLSGLKASLKHSATSFIEYAWGAAVRRCCGIEGQVMVLLLSEKPTLRWGDRLFGTFRDSGEETVSPRCCSLNLGGDPKEHQLTA